MSSTVNAGWLKDKNGDKFAPKTIASQVINNDGVSVDTLIDGKADLSHGNHVPTKETANNARFLRNDNTWQTVTPANIGAVAQSTYDSHTGNTTVHITSTERTNWGTAYTHSQSAHAPSNAEANQNAFSNIAVSGQTTVAADTKTDTVTFAGSNVTITTNATSDTVTFSVADGSTSTKGLLQLTNSTSSTSTTTAATPNSVKSAYDLANTANTAASTAQSRADSAYTLANGKVDSLSDLGITATSTELNYVDGVTSAIQTQLNNKVSTSRTINGKALSSNITLSAGDVSAYTKSEIDNYSFITVDDIDTICGSSIVAATASEVTF